MTRDTAFNETVDKLLGKLTVYDRHIRNPYFTQSEITEVSQGVLNTAMLKIFAAINDNAGHLKNHDSLQHLGFIMAASERYLAASGNFETAAAFTEFLKTTLFRCYLLDNTSAYLLERGLYLGSSLKNDIVKKCTYFNNIFKFENHFEIPFDVDCVFLTNQYCSFFLKMEKLAGYENFEEAAKYNTMKKQFGEFLDLVETAEKDRKFKTDKKRAAALLNRTKTEWPALAFSVAEISFDYDNRVLIARRFINDTSSLLPRRRDYDGIEANRRKKEMKRNLAIMLIVFTALAFLIAKIYVFFSWHPERQGWAVLISLFGLIFFYFMSFPVIGLLFWGGTKLDRR